jgi:hypothetical protein
LGTRFGVGFMENLVSIAMDQPKVLALFFVLHRPPYKMSERLGQALVQNPWSNLPNPNNRIG